MDLKGGDFSYADDTMHRTFEYQLRDISIKLFGHYCPFGLFGPFVAINRIVRAIEIKETEET